MIWLVTLVGRTSFEAVLVLRSGCSASACAAKASGLQPDGGLDEHVRARCHLVAAPAQGPQARSCSCRRTPTRCSSWWPPAPASRRTGPSGAASSWRTCPATSAAPRPRLTARQPAALGNCLHRVAPCGSSCQLVSSGRQARYAGYVGWPCTPSQHRSYFAA